MKLEKIERHELPETLTLQLLADENVYYFSYISFSGGCRGKEKPEDYWVALTEKRFLYRSKVEEVQSGAKYLEKNGIIPLEQISFIEVRKGSSTDGCGDKVDFYELHVASSGGVSIVLVPTEEKGFEIRQAYMDLNEYLKEQNDNNRQEKAKNNK